MVMTLLRRRCHYPMAAFANRVRGRVPLEKDFAQERADWYNVMPAYLLLTEREFSTYSSQSHWPRCLLFPCSLTCSCRIASHCKVQGAVASSIGSAAWALEGGHARSARRGGRPTCTRASGCCPCMLEKPLL